MQKTHDELISELRNIAGPDNVLARREDLLSYSFDATGIEYVPWAVVLPSTTAEVSAIMKLSDREGFFVVPRGAGSGMTGGSLPVQSGVVLALTRMNRIVGIDEHNMVAVVEPGVVTGRLQREVEARGLFYPPDPSSLAVSTIGGNVAECAGGARAVKYGVTKDYVLGLEAVLPSGEILKTGVQTAKGVVGYDLTKLLVGSEGTLAVVTRAVLKLLPLPESRKTLLAVFGSMEDAAVTVDSVMFSRIIPSCLEYMDQGTIRCVEEYLGKGLPVDAGAMLLIEVDGMRADVERSVSRIEELCRKNGASDVRVAKNDAEAEELWLARRSISPALFRLKPHKLNEDVTVPRSRLPEMVSALRDIERRFGLTLVSFGHAGDGNIHVNIMLDKTDPEQVEKGRRMVEEIFALTIRLGGTLSGEHGVGITKAPYLGMEIDSLGIDVMKRIKECFDPKGLLNPGKIFIDEQKNEYMEKMFPLPRKG